MNASNEPIPFPGSAASNGTATTEPVDAAEDLDLFGRPPPRGRSWAHRRGEPRIFAFFWTLYMLLATIGAFWSIGAPTAQDAMSLRPAARTVLAAITIGIAVLWPMLRLSQPERHPTLRWALRSVGQDLFVLLVPAQAVIWPQIAMAGWPVGVVGALACGLTAWGFLLGAVLVIAYVTPHLSRWWWMLLFVVIAGVGPLVALGPARGVGDQSDFGWWWMTSPVTTGFEITRDRPWTGASAAVSSGHWGAIGGVALAAGLAWMVLSAAGLFRRSPEA